MPLLKGPLALTVKAGADMMNGLLSTTESTENTEGETVTEGTRQEDPLTRAIIGAAIDVHRELGPGLYESAYRECLAYEMSKRGLKFQREKPLPVKYKEVKLDLGYKMDFVVEDQVVIEAKSVDKLTNLNQAQLLSYLKLGGYRYGLLINFNVHVLAQGVKRLVMG
jgi:GxxExxY protein